MRHVAVTTWGLPRIEQIQGRDIEISISITPKILATSMEPHSLKTEMFNAEVRQQQQRGPLRSIGRR